MVFYAGAVMATISGTIGNDVLIGTAADDTINGGGGADTISAGAGNDVIDESGNLVGANLDGGSGWDSLNIHTNGTAVSLGSNVKGIEWFGIDPQGSSTVQNVTITNSAFSGIDYSNIYVGLWNGSVRMDASAVTAGSVNLMGSGGNDTLLGGTGNDRFSGNGGNDSIDGGSGQNMADFYLGTVTSSILSGITLQKGAGQTWTLASNGVGWFTISQSNINLNTLTIADIRSPSQILDGGIPFGTYTLNNIQSLGFNAQYLGAGNNAQGLQAFNIEVGGTGSSLTLSLSNKTLLGTSGNDVLNGTSGNDFIYGSGGTDTINSGSGNDNIDEIGNLNGTNIDGGTDWDNLTVHTNGAAVTLGNNVKGIESFSFDPQGAASVQTVTITDVVFSGVQNNNININVWNGNSKIDASAVISGSLNLNGNNGNDTLLGGAGNDAIYGNGGSDVIDGGGGQNTVFFDLGQVPASALSGLTLQKGVGQTWTLASNGIVWFALTQTDPASNGLVLTDIRPASQIFGASSGFGPDSLNNIQYLDFGAFKIKVSGQSSSLDLSLDAAVSINTNFKYTAGPNQVWINPSTLQAQPSDNFIYGASITNGGLLTSAKIISQQSGADAPNASFLIGGWGTSTAIAFNLNDNGVNQGAKDLTAAGYSGYSAKVVSRLDASGSKFYDLIVSSNTGNPTASASFDIANILHSVRFNETSNQTVQHVTQYTYQVFVSNDGVQWYGAGANQNNQIVVTWDDQKPLVSDISFSGSKIFVGFSKTIAYSGDGENLSNPTISQFTVTVNGVVQTINSLVVTNGGVQLVMPQNLASTDKVLVSYSSPTSIDPLAPAIQSAYSLNRADSFTNVAAHVLTFLPFGKTLTLPTQSYHPRMGAAGWSGNNFYITEYPTDTYMPGSVNQATVELDFQNNVGDLIASNTRVELSTAWTALKGTNGKPFTFTTNSDGSIKAGAFWFDAGSSTGTTYSIKYESFNITLPSSTNSKFALNSQSNVQTLVSGIKLGNNYSWGNSSTNFALYWETAVDSSNKKTVNIAYFDPSGNAFGSPVTPISVSASTYTSFGGPDSDGNYLLLTYTGNALAFQLYNATGVLNTNNYASSGSVVTNINSSTITSDTYDWINKNSNGSFANYMIAVSGVRNNIGVIDFYQIDAKTFAIKNTQSIALSGSAGASRIMNIRLSDNATEVFAYQDGTNLHMTQVGGDGYIVSDAVQTLPTGAIFDRLRGLGNGLFEVIGRVPGSAPNSYDYVVQLFDTRASGVNVNNTSTASPTNAAGTVFNDMIAISAANSMVLGSEGNDVLTANASASGSILSYEFLGEGITANLATGSVTALNSQGAVVKSDTISGFQNIILTQYDDNVTGSAADNMFYALGGNDTINGGDGIDTVVFQNSRDNYAIIQSGSNWVVTSQNSGAKSSVTLSNVELLSFDNGTVVDLRTLGSNQPMTGNVTIASNNALPLSLGQALAATSTLADADGMGALFYQWLRNGSVIPGANSASYQIAQADLGQMITVQASYTDGWGVTNSAISNKVVPVVPLTASTFHKVDPAGTYLGGINETVKKSATVLSLSQLGFTPGSYINIQQVGDFQYGLGIDSKGVLFTDRGNNLLGVFLDANGNYITAKNAQNYSSQIQSNGAITDIGQDFKIDSNGLNILIPQGAVSLALTVDDVWYSDNFDPNNNFGVNITSANHAITGFGPALELASGSYHPRMGAAGWNAYQFFVNESPVAGYVKGATNQFNVELNLQNNVGDFIVSNCPITLGTAWSSLTGTNGKPFTFTTNSDGSVKSGAFWFDKGSATGTTYSVKYESFNITLPTTNGVNFPTITSQSSIQTILSGMSIGNNYGWGNAANNFALFWESPINTASNTKTENVAFFDTNGLALGYTFTPLTVSATDYVDFGGPETDNDYVMFRYSGTSVSLQLFNPQGLTTTNYANSGTFNININSATFTAEDWNITNRNANGSYANYQIAVSGTRNNQGVIDFYQIDAKSLAVNKTQTVTLSGSIGASRIQDIRLSDNSTSVFAYQDGTTLHLTEIGSDGTILADYTQALASGAIFDRIRSLTNGLFEIIYRQPGSATNAMNYEVQLFDTRSAPLSINNVSTTAPTNYAGTASNDAINVAASNSMVMGSEGNDVLTASATAYGAILSYEYLNEGITANLSTGTVKAYNAQNLLVKSDIISGFQTLVGTRYNDSITGDSNNNTFFVLGGNDTINGNGGSDYAEFSNERTDYLITQSGSSWTVTDRSSSPYSGTTTLTNVRYLEFGWDGTVIDLTAQQVNHAMTGTVSISGQTGIGQTLTASNSLADADGVGTISYQWLRNGIAISGAVASSYQLVQTDAGNSITVKASYIDGWGVSNSSTSSELAIPVPATSLSGQVYFWNKSGNLGHALLSGVSVSTSGSTGTAQSQVLLSNVSVDNTGAVTADVFANLSVSADSFDLNLALGASSTNTVFTAASALSNFNVLSNAANGNLKISGFGNITGTSVQTLAAGQIKLGSISFNIGLTPQFQIAVQDGTNFNNSGTGQLVNVIPYAFVSNSVITDANGKYSMQLSPGNYTVTAKDASSSIGNTITAADALAALKIAVGLNPNAFQNVSSYQIIAADVNKDGKVNAADALAILKQAVNYPGAISPSWQFLNENVDLSQISRTNTVYTPSVSTVAASFIQNMVGLIAGDVNGSWSPTSGSSYLEAANPNYFTQLSQKISSPTSQWGV